MGELRKSAPPPRANSTMYLELLISCLNCMHVFVDFKVQYVWHFLYKSGNKKELLKLISLHAFEIGSNSIWKYYYTLNCCGYKLKWKVNIRHTRTIRKCTLRNRAAWTKKIERQRSIKSNKNEDHERDWNEKTKLAIANVGCCKHEWVYGINMK